MSIRTFSSRLTLGSVLIASACFNTVAQASPPSVVTPTPDATDLEQEFASPIRSDEMVVLFPTLAARTADGWLVQVHGWIYEPERDSRVRASLIERFGMLIGLTEAEREKPEFKEIASRFVADNERGKSIRVHIGDHSKVMPASGANGHFKGEINLTDEQAKLVEQDAHGRITIEVRPTSRPERKFAGHVTLLAPEGLSVISDIDDTIKVSNVLDKQELLRSSFAKPFEAVPGMADFYKKFADEGASFHYVSASPWQLYVPLAAFIQGGGFPPGSMHLRDFRFKDETALELLSSPRSFKTAAIRDLIQRFPQRRFVLIGDTSEDDPEAFSQLAKEFAEQIVFIAIRDCGEESLARAARASLEKLPAGKWIVFGSPSEVDAKRIRLELRARER